MPSDGEAPSGDPALCGDGGLTLDPTFNDGGTVRWGRPLRLDNRVYNLVITRVAQSAEGHYVLVAEDADNAAVLRLLLAPDGSQATIDGVFRAPAVPGAPCPPSSTVQHATGSGALAGEMSRRSSAAAGRSDPVRFAWTDAELSLQRAERIAELPNGKSVVAGTSHVVAPEDLCKTGPRSPDWTITAHAGLLGADGGLEWTTPIRTAQGTLVESITLVDGAIVVSTTDRDGVGAVTRLSPTGQLLWTVSGSETVALDEGRIATSEGTLLADGGVELAWDAGLGLPRFVDDAGSIYFGAPPGQLRRRFPDGGIDPGYAAAPGMPLHVDPTTVWKGCTVTRVEDGALRRYRY